MDKPKGENVARTGNFIRRRVERGDLAPEEVTPKQVAEIFLADIESGRANPTKVLVLFEEEDEDQVVESSCISSALTYEEMLMMLAWWQKWVLDSVAR